MPQYLFDLVKAEGMANTTVVVSGQTPAGACGPAMARGKAGAGNLCARLIKTQKIAPDYSQRALRPG